MVNGQYRTQDRIVQDFQDLQELVGHSGELYFRTAREEELAKEHLLFGQSISSYSFDTLNPNDPIYADLRTDDRHLLFWVQRSTGKQQVIGIVTSDPRVMMRTGNRRTWQSTPDFQQALIAVGIK